MGVSPRLILVELLRTLPDVQEAWDPRSGGGGPRLMPSAYHEGSYAELEQQLALLRDTHRQHWWHLSHRYRSIRRLGRCRRVDVEGPGAWNVLTDKWRTG